MRERARQALSRLALEPIAETTAAPHSSGCRKDRSPADAMMQCSSILARQGSAQGGLEGDGTSCCDTRSPDGLRPHVPMDKGVLRQWCKAGDRETQAFHPTEAGTPQGGILTLPTKVPTWCESFRRVFHEPNCAPAMGMGFLGPPGRADSPWRTRHHGSKETSVARRAHRGSTTLEVRITFAPSRVSPACVAQAYERVGPSTRHPMPQGLSTRQAECAPETQRVGRRSVSCIPPR